MKTRKKELDEEVKNDPSLRSTEDLEVDETKLTEEQKEKGSIPWTSIIIMGVLIILIVTCIIVIFSFGKPS